MRGDFHRTSDEQVLQINAPQWCKTAFKRANRGRNSVIYP